MKNISKIGFKNCCSPFHWHHHKNEYPTNWTYRRWEARLTYSRKHIWGVICQESAWWRVGAQFVGQVLCAWAGLGWAGLLPAARCIFWPQTFCLCPGRQQPAECGEKSAILCKILESWLYQTFSASLQLKSNCSFCYFLASGLLEPETPSFHNPSIVTMIEICSYPAQYTGICMS